MYITQDEARIHNLTIRFAKILNTEELKNELNYQVLSEKLYFREKDFEIAVNGGILKKIGENYLPTNKLIEQVRFLHKKIVVDKEKDFMEYKEIYLKKFEELKSMDNYKPTEELIKLASKIHWHIVPEYEEYMIVNSELYPNLDTKEYYNHFHTLEDLYRELTNQGKKIDSKKGDANLNKKITINIYSRRWDHTDPYTITRTSKGWTVAFHQAKDGNKEGEALISLLKHDSINYPNSLGSFMWHLWNKADNHEMSVDELKVDLENIAKWINICEKNTPENIEV